MPIPAWSLSDSSLTLFCLGLTFSGPHLRTRYDVAKETLGTYVGHFDFAGENPDELTFREGDILELHEKSPDGLVHC